MSAPVTPAGSGAVDDGVPVHRVESPGADVLRALGLEALVELVETTAYGVCVTGDDHTWVYLNPAGERIIGKSLEELRGRDYLLHFPPHERAVLLALEGTQRHGDTDFYTNTVLREDGPDREMTWSGTVMHVDGGELAPAIFHETTPVRQAQRNAQELGAAAVHAEAERGRTDVLSNLVHEAVAATRACAAVLLCEDPDGWVQVAAASGSRPGVADAVLASAARLSDVVADDVTLGRSLFVSDAADQLSQDVRTRAWVPLLATVPWGGAAMFGVECEGQIVGVLLVLIPVELTAPSESELVLWSSLADQAGVALGAERVREQVSQHSVLSERSRIARDLHDSVSQALFSLHARAQVVRRALAVDDRPLALEAAADLELLTRQATTELRVLLGELRPAGPASAELVPRLRELAEAVRVREGLPVELSVSPAPLPALPPALVEHLPRIVGEALHNTVKHAGASGARVSVTVQDDVLRLVAADDGQGFAAGTGDGNGAGHGQRTMRERTALLGGRIEIRSSPDAGTTVTVTVPVRR